MTTVRQIVKLFELNPRFIKKEWILPLRELQQYELPAIRTKLEAILERTPDKPRMYYLEGVRRSLREDQNNASKRAPVAQSIRTIMQGMK